MATVPQHANYDPEVALEFFKAGGKPEKFAKGKVIFAEAEKAKHLLLQRERIYLLVEGEVSLLAKKQLLGAVKAGEIFGEMAAISHTPRSASAVATTDCSVISLDDKEFKAALRKTPGFALMLMSVMIWRLRDTIARLGAAGSLSASGAWKNSAVFDKDLLADLVKGLADDPGIYYRQGQNIMKEGQTALRMYVVLEGTVAVSIGDSVVERIGPGGVLGELALVDQTTRLANAEAESDCTLLPVNRNAFIALIKTSPEFADQMLTALVDRLRILDARLR